MKNRGHILLDYLLAMMFFVSLLLFINRNLLLFVKLQNTVLKNELEIYTASSSLIRKIRTRDIGYDKRNLDIYISDKIIKFGDEGQETIIRCSDRDVYANRKRIIKGGTCCFKYELGVLEIKLKKGEIEITRRVRL
ncbi:hypothetical protein [Streptobacillus moniliformis]|uniref:hypothetical protein n=1 Tax=Streptobacillus moniliformis TaxID=34105 RepID=UPI0007E46E12|nr:hypothetical protein [Streptobacillus moniliformis]